MWQIFPGDLNKTLAWKPEIDLHLERTVGEIGAYVVVSAIDQSRVRVIPAGKSWPVEEVRDVLQEEAERKERL
ncbi:hypothetical protein [Bradyrhizobium sp. CCGUVB23]|uniref:hypothetical protein n=1 Tax=Bradyrhizobium sp. CCGUVB23 TaxID=2949630 RepID=UPI0020B316E9|nr:hypothetical protein [Bradyrhizobium sp. CCGUVB23]MCP3459636.1 hypothetical protein [Bradyrhizobium sp. CCGUVB23]